ncbi:MAG: GDP-mannose 4,6-dehydratase [Candidatus Thermoplasmatota archaeon]|nr:GDP-mannose 4,6-dehydratase [Candidatus Thermoplasmatota archaeon]
MSTLVTGSAGFIGFHVAKGLLERRETVVGVDSVNDYYSQELKWDRNSILEGYEDFEFYKQDLCDLEALEEVFEENRIDRICHLAAQAGVRYSVENPHAYERSNLKGFTNILEMARHEDVDNLVYASSSSVYGGNEDIPYTVGDDVNEPVSYYAATKVANEVMAHSYNHLYDIPCTGLRFFTVYGPWGRPDMAMFKFTDRIVDGRPIEVYNYGDMKRDFTYIDDIVGGVISSLEKKHDYEIFNLGNNTPVELMEFIEMLEDALGVEAEKEMKPMQPGDMKVTYADISGSKEKLGFEPKTDLKEGIEKFVNWYKDYFNVDI